MDYLKNLYMQIYAWSQSILTRQKALRTAAEWTIFNVSTKCYMCQVFSNDKACKNFDHDHLTRKFKKTVCDDCSRKMVQQRRTMAIYFHNYKNYDNHV